MSVTIKKIGQLVIYLINRPTVFGVRRIYGFGLIVQECKFKMLGWYLIIQRVHFYIKKVFTARCSDKKCSSNNKA